MSKEVLEFLAIARGEKKPSGFKETPKVCREGERMVFCELCGAVTRHVITTRGGEEVFWCCACGCGHGYRVR